MTNHTAIRKTSKTQSLNWFLILGTIVLINFNCSTPKKNIAEQKELPKIRINISGDSDIENLIFVKIGGFGEEDFRPFKVPLICHTLDLYQLLTKKGDNFTSEQLWLKGDKITIVGEIENEKLKIDSVINSPFYYYTNEVFKEYEKLTENFKKLETGNDFLLTEITKTINSPFSNQLASVFIDSNIDKPENLKQLQKLLDTQSDEIKNHMMSVHEDLRQIINVDAIQSNKFKFNNEVGEEVNLPLAGDSLYILDFWFTQCPPCISDHKIIQSKIESFDEAGIEILGISTDYDESDWRTFLNKKNYGWVNFIEVEENESTLSQHLGISVFPTYLVVNGEGKILNRNNSLEKSITYLKESKLMKN